MCRLFKGILQMIHFYSRRTRTDFVIQWHQLLLLTPQFKAISDCWQRKLFQPANQNKNGPKSFPESSRVDSRLVQENEVSEQLYAYSERRRIHLKLCLPEFFIRFRSCAVIVSFKPKIPKNYNAFCSASESNKQKNLRDRILDLPFFFR